MAHRDDEVGADEGVDLTELHRFRRVVVRRGAQHDEEGLVVTLELGALVRDDRVLDGEGVEVEDLRDLLELPRRRLRHADPRHARAVVVV